MSSPTAVILAAGLGRRLGTSPKPLFEVGGRPLLRHCADALRACRVERVAVVTGFRADLVEAAAREVFPEGVELVHNAEYERRNNFYSVMLACTELPSGPLVIVNGDVVFSARLVGAAHMCDADLVLVVDESPTDAESLGVAVVDDEVVDMGKHIAPADADGEFVGISVLREDARRAYVAAAVAAIERGETDLYYEDVYKRILPAVNVRVVAAKPLEWAEIDAPSDVDRASQVARAVGNA
jgi:L-glutamine-phosphate cytidylyltransferase